jgi:hypothetical protein
LISDRDVVLPYVLKARKGKAAAAQSAKTAADPAVKKSAKCVVDSIKAMDDHTLEDDVVAAKATARCHPIYTGPPKEGLSSVTEGLRVVRQKQAEATGYTVSKPTVDRSLQIRF